MGHKVNRLHSPMANEMNNKVRSIGATNALPWVIFSQLHKGGKTKILLLEN